MRTHFSPNLRLVGLALLSLSIIAMSACQSAPTQTAVTPIPTRPPALGDEPLDDEPGVTQTVSPAVTEELSIEPTPESVDPWQGINPRDQKFYFWYALPPLTAADRALNAVVDQFNQSNPYGIVVDAYNQSTSADLLQRLESVVGAADQPALIQTDAYLVQSLVDQGLLTDLTSLVSSPALGFEPDTQSAWLPSIQQSANLSTQLEIPGLPLGAAAQVLIYNQDWLIELGFIGAPKSTDELRQAACRAAEQPFSRGPGLTGPGLVLTPDYFTLSAWVHMFGARLTADEATGYQISSPEARTSLEFLASLLNDGCAQLVSSISEMQSLFTSNQTLLVFGQSELIPALASEISTGAFTWSAAPIPYHLGSPVSLIRPVVRLSILNTSPEQQAAAWTFIQYAFSSEAQQTWASLSGAFPVSETAAAAVRLHPSYTSLIPAIRSAVWEYELPADPLADAFALEAFNQLSAGATPVGVLIALDQQLNQALTEFYSQLE